MNKRQLEQLSELLADLRVDSGDDHAVRYAAAVLRDRVARDLDAAKRREAEEAAAPRVHLCGECLQPMSSVAPIGRGHGGTTVRYPDDAWTGWRHHEPSADGHAARGLLECGLTHEHGPHRWTEFHGNACYCPGKKTRELAASASR